MPQALNAYPEINGVYDMVMHNYGPDSYTGSVHIEVDDTISADQLDERYYSQPNRALAARLRTITYGLRWVLPIAEGDL